MIKTLRLEPAGMDLGDRDGHDEPSVGDSDIFVGIYWQSFGWESDLERDYKAGSGSPAWSTSRFSPPIGSTV